MRVFSISLIALLASFCHGQVSSSVDIPPISNNRTINIVNNCSFPIYPGILTTNGTSPYTSGFLLNAKKAQEIWVSHDWVGRIWGRTNCTWAPANSTTNVTNVIDYDVNDNSLVGGCLTGDCGPSIQCHLSGVSPCTLAEFSITGWQDLTYYDISLVDGYNLDMSITPHVVSAALQKNNTPVCVASTWLESQTRTDITKNGLNETYSFANIQRWCPRDMLLFDYQKGKQSVFPYPDDHDENIRGGWTPCLSACAYTNSDWDCCKGKYNKPETCGPNGYSVRAKQVCGDAYSYAYDDHTSTFALPTGPGFDITFCPSGVSTNIMRASQQKSAAVKHTSLSLSFSLSVASVIYILVAMF